MSNETDPTAAVVVVEENVELEMLEELAPDGVDDGLAPDGADARLEHAREALRMVQAMRQELGLPDSDAIEEATLSESSFDRLSLVLAEEMIEQIHEEERLLEIRRRTRERGKVAY